jgi:hypothetical protein
VTLLTFDGSMRPSLAAWLSPAVAVLPGREVRRPDFLRPGRRVEVWGRAFGPDQEGNVGSALEKHAAEISSKRARTQYYVSHLVPLFRPVL